MSNLPAALVVMIAVMPRQAETRRGQAHPQGARLAVVMSALKLLALRVKTRGAEKRWHEGYGETWYPPWHVGEASFRWLHLRVKGYCPKYTTWT